MTMQLSSAMSGVHHYKAPNLRLLSHSGLPWTMPMRCFSVKRSRHGVALCSFEVGNKVRRKCSPFLEEQFEVVTNAPHNSTPKRDLKVIPDIWRSNAEKYGDMIALVDRYHDPPSKLTHNQRVAEHLQDTILNLSMESCLPDWPVRPMVPTRETKPMQLPVIDFSMLHQGEGIRSITIRDIATACQEIGCFQVINHGIRNSIMKGALETASDFFELPVESKAEFTSPDISRRVQYDCSNGGINKSRSFLKQYAHPLDKWIQFWPQDPPSYREKMGRYAVAVRKVALGHMDAILQSLGLGTAYLGAKLEEGLQVLSVNSYPQSTRPGVTMGLGSHSDYAFINILLPSCSGLEVMDHENKAWKSILKPSGTLHVHIGDHLEVLSNGKYRTVVHRAVLNHENSSVSIASFHGLAMNEKVRNAEELVNEQNPRMYKESSFTDFLDFLLANNTGNKSYIDSLRRCK